MTRAAEIVGRLTLDFTRGTLRLATAMTTPIKPDVVLDEETIQELWPPCEVVDYTGSIITRLLGLPGHEKPCDQRAAWIARSCCHCGQHDIILLCNRHYVLALRELVACSGCWCPLARSELTFEELT